MKNIILSRGSCVVCGVAQEPLPPERFLERNEFFKLPTDRAVSFWLCQKCAETCLGKATPSGFPQTERLVKALEAAARAYDFNAERAEVEAAFEAIAERLDEAEKLISLGLFDDGLKSARLAERAYDLLEVDDLPVLERIKDAEVTAVERLVESSGNWSKLESPLRALLAAREALFGAGSVEVADCLFRLGNALVQLKRRPEALEHLKRCMAISETLEAEDRAVLQKKLMKTFADAHYRDGVLHLAAVA